MSSTEHEARCLNGSDSARPELRAWAMYDWANSAYQTTIIAAVFPIYFHSVVAADLGDSRGDEPVRLGDDASRS